MPYARIGIPSSIRSLRVYPHSTVYENHLQIEGVDKSASYKYELHVMLLRATENTITMHDQSSLRGAIPVYSTQILIKQLILFWFIFIGAAFVLYWPALNTFFLSDDFSLIHAVRENGPLGVWTSGQQFWRPLISLSLFCDDQVWGLNATGYHLTNILAHVLNAVLVSCIALLLLRSWGIQSPDKVAFLAGALFLALPSHAEAVTWVSGRTDVIAACFALASLAAYLIYKLYHKRTALYAAFVLFAFGLASKESTVSLPLVMLACELCLLAKTPSGHRRELFIPFLFVIVLFGYLILRRIMLGTFIGGYGGNIVLSTLIKNFASFVAASYLPRLPSPIYYATALMVILIVCIVQFVKRKRMLVPFGWLLLLFVLSTLPALYTAMLVEGIHADGQNERFIYLPSAFSCIGLALLLYCLSNNARRLNIMASLTLLVFSIQIYQSNLNWKVAGDVSQQLAGSFQALLPARNIIVLTVPDTIKGAYVYRNGFDAAAALFYEGKFKQLTIVSIARFWNQKDSVSITSQSEALYSLHLPNPEYRTPSSTCGLFDYRARGEHFEAILDENCNLRVQLKNLSLHDRVVSYSAGRLIMLPPSEGCSASCSVSSDRGAGGS